MLKPNFVKGLKVKTIKTKYGEIIKLAVNMDDFQQNPLKKNKYLDIDILTSKSGNKYAVINDYKKNVDAETVKEEFDGKEITEDEIPF